MAERKTDREVQLEEENAQLRAALRAVAATAVLATSELPIVALEEAPGLLAQARILVDRLQH